MSYIDSILNNITHEEFILNNEFKGINLFNDDKYLMCKCPYLKNFDMAVEIEDCEKYDGIYFCKNCPYLRYLKNNNIGVNQSKVNKIDNKNCKNNNKIIDLQDPFDVNLTKLE